MLGELPTVARVAQTGNAQHQMCFHYLEYLEKLRQRELPVYSQLTGNSLITFPLMYQEVGSL